MKKLVERIVMLLLVLGMSVNAAWAEDDGTIYYASLKAQKDPSSTGSGNVKLTWLDITGRPMEVNLAKQLNWAANSDIDWNNSSQAMQGLMYMGSVEDWNEIEGAETYSGPAPTAQVLGGTMVAMEGMETPVEMGTGSQIYMTSFVYTGESAGTNMLTISYIADKLPDEVLSELTEGWGDPGSVESSESYFPGTSDKWGLWRTLLSNGEGSGLSENVFAGEYNGGVLMFDFTTHKAEDDSIDIPVSDALSAVIDSIKYEDFAPQTMYEDYPGVYKMEETEEIEGEEMTYEYSITLNEDHSGVISIQDDINMMWGSNLLIGADFSYDYSVDGDKLTVDMDGNQLTFTR